MRGASGDDPDGADESGDATEATAAPTRTGDSREPEDGGQSESGGEPQGDATATDAVESDPDAADPDAADPGTMNPGATDQTTVDPDAIDPSALTVSERSLHPRIRTLWIVRSIVWAFVLGAIAAAIDWQWLGYGPIVPGTIAALLLVLFVGHAVLRYRAWQYEFREDAIYLERGVLTRVRTVVPFVRIQHVDTARGPIDRAAGLSTLVVYTAGSRGADVAIPGIEAERASDHQRRLKQLAIAAEDDTAV